MIDTPGFDDTLRTDAEILQEVANWLNEAYAHQISLWGIVYLHRISDVRLHGSSARNLRILKKLCGDKSLAGVVLATTMWDYVTLEEGTSREQQLTSASVFWKDLIDHGSKVFRQDAGQESAITIIKYLTEPRRLFGLDIQIDMVDKALTLDQTAAGKEVEEEILKSRKRDDAKKEEVSRELEQAVRMKDKDLQEQLTEYIAEIDNKMQVSLEDLKKIRVSRDGLRQQVLEQRERQRVQGKADIEQKSQHKQQEAGVTKDFDQNENSGAQFAPKGLGTTPQDQHVPETQPYNADMVVMNPYYQQRPICGASIGAFNGDHLPPVSLGGIIMVDGQPFGLTVHHILDAPSDDDDEPGGNDGKRGEDASRSTRIGSSRPLVSNTSALDAQKSDKDVEGESQAILSPSEDLSVGKESSRLEASDLELSEPNTDESSEYDLDLSEDEAHLTTHVGDIDGIAPGEGAYIKITQPAIDDLDDDFFPNEEDRDDDHLSSHEFGHVYASSGIRRWRRNGILHEIDWALIKILDNRLQPYNVVQGGRRFHANPMSVLKPPTLKQPVDRRHYTPEEDEYPVEVANADSLGGLNVHCFGRTTGLQGGMIGESLTSVRIYRRKTFSKSWFVAGSCKWYASTIYHDSNCECSWRRRRYRGLGHR
jgi:hypothetical protein